MTVRGLAALVPLVVLLAAVPARAATVATVTLDGVISPVTVRLVESALDRAQSSGAIAATCAAIVMKTPAEAARAPVGAT